MAGEVATAYVSLIPSFRGGARAMERELDGPAHQAGVSGGQEYGEGMHQSMSSGATKIFAPLAAAAAGLGALDFFKGAISGASDLNESTTKIQAIFGDATGAVQKFASGGAKALGQTKLDVLNAASTFGTFGKAAGLAGPDLAKFSTGFAGLSTDLASFYNTDPAQATEAIGAALRGESEPIRAYGVLLDEATLKAEAMNLGLLKPVKNKDAIIAAQTKVTLAQRAYNKAVKDHGKDSGEALTAQVNLTSSSAALKKATDGTIPPLTQQQKVLAAQSAIYKQTKDAQGDFGRTSGGLANQQRILSATFKDFQTQIGTYLLPIMLKVVATGGKLLGWIQANIPAVVAIGGAILTLTAITMAYNASLAITAAGGLTSYLKATKVAQMGAKAFAISQWLVNAAINANPIVLIVGLLIALGVAIVVLWKKNETFRKIVMAAWAGIKVAVKAVADWFTQTMLPALKRAFDVVWSFLKTMFKWSPIGIVVSNWGAIREKFSSVLSSIKGFFSTAWDLMKKVFGWTPLGLITTHWGKIIGFFRSLPGKVTSAISGIWNGFGSGFRAALNSVIGAWNGLSFTIPSIKAFGKTIGGGTVSTPNIPYLASGGILTRPTLMVGGEGREPEAVLPLSKLENLLGGRGVNGGSGRGGVNVIVQGDVRDPYAFAKQLDRDIADRMAIESLRGVL